MGEIGISDITSVGENSMIERVPANALYFGIFELCELLVYADTPSVFHGNFLMFSFAACAVFSIMKLVQDFILGFDPDNIDDSLDLDTDGITIDFAPADFSLKESLRPTRVITNFLYDNVFAYASCLIMYHAYAPVAEKFNEVFASGSLWNKILAVFIIALLIILPSIPQVIQFLLYVLSTSLLEKLLNHMEVSLPFSGVLSTVVIFAVAVIFLLAVNFIITKVGDFTMLFFKAAFPALIGIIMFLALATAVVVHLRGKLSG